MRFEHNRAYLSPASAGGREWETAPQSDHEASARKGYASYDVWYGFLEAHTVRLAWVSATSGARIEVRKLPSGAWEAEYTPPTKAESSSYLEHFMDHTW